MWRLHENGKEAAKVEAHLRVLCRSEEKLASLLDIDMKFLPETSI